MARQLTFHIFRYNPVTPEIEPYMQTFHLEEGRSMTLFLALNQIRETQDASLQFDFTCRAAICGACGMIVNGKPGLACKTQTSSLPNEITLLPLPVFKLIGDLSVDTGVWFRDMAQNTESWIHTDKVFDPEAEEERMDNDLAEKIYELDRCIECGCCVSACGTARMRENFMGATALLRVTRFMEDPRDERSMEEYYRVVGNEHGIFGCMGLLACDDVCPKQLPLHDQLGWLRKKLGFWAVKSVLTGG